MDIVLTKKIISPVPRLEKSNSHYIVGTEIAG